MKQNYYITYRDRHNFLRSTFIKAKSKDDAEKKFYAKDNYSLIVKISLN